MTVTLPLPLELLPMRPTVFLTRPPSTRSVPVPEALTVRVLEFTHEPLVTVSVEPSAMQFVQEWAAALGGEFRAESSEAER